MLEHKTEVCILGAGVSGLSAALVLSERDLGVVVLEKGTSVGGLSRTIHKDGFRFDLGGHRFFTHEPAIDAFFQRIIGEELMWVNRRSRIYHNGKYFSYPLQLMQTLRSVGPRTGIKMIASYLQAKTLTNLSDHPIISVEDWLVNKFGRVLYETFFKTYTEKVWGIPCDQISRDWACQRIREMSLLEAIKSLFSKKSEKNLATLVDRFMYPELGIGRLSERLMDRVGQERTWLGCEVTAICLQGNQIEQITFRKQSNEGTIRVQDVISSIPLPQLIHLITPVAPPAVLAAASKLRYRDLVTVTLCINRERVTDDTWLYIQDPRVKMSRIHEPKNWSPKMVPAGKTCLVIEYPCFDGDETWTSSDDQLIQQASAELSMIGLLSQKELLSGLVVRVPLAYPIYDIGYETSCDIIKAYLHSISNLQIVGRNGMHRYNNIDHCVETGIKAAANLLGASYDLELVNAEPSYLEKSPIRSSETLRWEDLYLDFTHPAK